MVLKSAIVIVEVEVRGCFPSINSDRDHESKQRRRCPPPSGNAQEVLRTEPALVVQVFDRADPGEYGCQLSHSIAERPPYDTHGLVLADHPDVTEQGMGLTIHHIRPVTAATSGPRTVRECRRLYSRLSPKADRHHDIPTERSRRVRVFRTFDWCRGS